jgi:hypothetical protein
MKKSSNETKLKLHVSIELTEIPLKKSGVPTSPLDGVTVILIDHQILLVYIVNILFFTSFYTSRIRFPTDAQLFSSLNKRHGLISSEGAAHTKQPSLLLSI